MLISSNSVAFFNGLCFYLQKIFLLTKHCSVIFNYVQFLRECEFPINVFTDNKFHVIKIKKLIELHLLLFSLCRANKVEAICFNDVSF